MASKWNDPLHNFYEHIFITDSCWFWTGAVDKDLYGISAIQQKKIPAHRASYILHSGEIPVGLYVLHTCHNPTCVNPMHLKIGTQKENIQDQINLGTNVGKNRITAKLNPELVNFIRSSNLHYIDLANHIGVSKYCVWDVLHNRSWKHVKN